MKEKLRIGILLNNLTIPSWEYHLLNKIVDSDISAIKLVIKYGYVPANHLNPILDLIEKTDQFIFKNSLNYAIKKDSSVFFKDVPELNINASGNQSGSDIEKIREYKLDVILQLGSHNLTTGITGLSKYGIWSYSLNDDYSPHPGAGFSEVMNNNPVSKSELRLLNDQNGQEILFRSWESTCPYSVTVNRNKLYWRATLFVPRILNGLYNYGEAYLISLKKKFSSEGMTDSNTVIRNNTFSYLAKVTKAVCRKLYYSDAYNWDLLINIDKNSDYSTAFDSFKRIPSPKGFFWADPFVIAENDNYFIFVEEFVHKIQRAHLSVLKLDNEGRLLSADKIIEKPYHMSYPQVFKIANTYYMLPETSKNKTIELYKCTDFPWKWEFDRNLMENISAVDSTLFYYNSKWWLFTSIDQTGKNAGSSTELFLYYSEDFLSGKWKRHPCNPIVSDIRKARMAGKLFFHEGKILRPSQDCSVRYGKGFGLNHITKLSEMEYNETIEENYEPVWDTKLKGAHTFNFDKNLTVIDVYSYRKRISIN